MSALVKGVFEDLVYPGKAPCVKLLCRSLGLSLIHIYPAYAFCPSAPFCAPHTGFQTHIPFHNPSCMCFTPCRRRRSSAYGAASRNGKLRASHFSDGMFLSSLFGRTGTGFLCPGSDGTYLCARFWLVGQIGTNRVVLVVHIIVVHIAAVVIAEPCFITVIRVRRAQPPPKQHLATLSPYHRLSPLIPLLLFLFRSLAIHAPSTFARYICSMVSLSLIHIFSFRRSPFCLRPLPDMSALY